MIFVVLPAYNEEKVIGTLIEKIDRTMKGQRLDYKILLVDDGSADGTIAAASFWTGRTSLEILRHEKNKGLGRALRTGLSHAVAIGGNHDIVVTMDADETHSPDLILGLKECIEAGCDFVVASRFARDAKIVGLPVYRKFLGFAASMLFRIFFPIKGLKDYTCGLRAYRLSLLKRGLERYGDSFLSERGFSFQVDCLLKLRLLHPVIGEIPLLLRYDMRRGASKMNVGKTIYDTLRLFCRHLWRGKS